MLLAIPGGSAYYFVNVGTFAAIVFVAAYAGPFLVRHLPSLFRPELILAVMMLVILDTDQKTRSPSTFAGEFAELQERTRGYLGEGTPAAPVTSASTGGASRPEQSCPPGAGKRREALAAGAIGGNPAGRGIDPNS